ncbi:unnamed protein product [Blepharisma stoltei]|uniref:Maturase K n=1 Tax=Blepharisma stoltei TaxID=1481888 RepID=A0AAU9J0J7_9CILI|nr:unnamed protein product [Blepharisma stoltei]
MPKGGILLKNRVPENIIFWLSHFEISINFPRLYWSQRILNFIDELLQQVSTGHKFSIKKYYHPSQISSQVTSLYIKSMHLGFFVLKFCISHNSLQVFLIMRYHSLKSFQNSFKYFPKTIPL